MKLIEKFSDNSQGIFYAILSSFYISIMVGSVRHLSDDFNVFFIIMMRNLFAFSFFAPLIFKTKGRIFKTSNFKLHIIRNINGFVGMAIWFYAITLLPLADTISITFIVPIITTLAAMFFLKEKINSRIWVSMAIGLCGILVIIRPGFKEFHYAYLLAFFVTFTWALTNILVKIMTRSEKPNAIVAYMSALSLLISIPFGLLNLQAVSLIDLFWFAMIGLFSNMAHISMSKSYAKVDLSIVQPFDFLRLVFISIISYIFFSEVVDFYTFIGAAIIVCGVAFIAPKKKKPYKALLNN